MTPVPEAILVIGSVTCDRCAERVIPALELSSMHHPEQSISWISSLSTAPVLIPFYCICRRTPSYLRRLQIHLASHLPSSRYWNRARPDFLFDASPSGLTFAAETVAWNDVHCERWETPEVRGPRLSHCEMALLQWWLWFGRTHNYTIKHTIECTIRLSAIVQLWAYRSYVPQLKKNQCDWSVWCSGSDSVAIC